MLVNIINSPFEQFQLYSFFDFFTSWTKTSFFLIIALFVFFFYYTTILNLKPADLAKSNSWELARYFPRRKDSHLQIIMELIYDFLYQLVKTYIGKKGLVFFPIIADVFLWIVCLNLLGMIPYGFTVTSHIATTGGFALAVFLGIQIIGIVIHRWKLLQIFLPNGAPMWLIPIIPLIEAMSYSFRVFSLAIRLIANMTSGHLLIHIFAGFSWTMIQSGGFLLVLFPVAFALVFALNGLEMGISLLQGYVFSILVCIYLSDVIHNKHD